MEADDGTIIVTDPFDESVGYEMPDVKAHIVTTSHDHFDHNYVRAVKGKFRHVSTAGTFSVSGIVIKGIKTFHDDAKGAKRGRNIVFVFDIDGLRVCHCGDLGHEPGSMLQQQLKGVDIMMIPVGGTFTIDAQAAARTVELIAPKTVIPMHYRTEVLDFPVEGVQSFLKITGNSGIESVKEINIDAQSINRLPSVVVMDYRHEN